MLKGTKSTTLNYQSLIDGKPAVFMTGQVPENGSSTVNKNITDMDLYDANRRECRADMAQFDDMIYDLEDQRMSQITDGPETDMGGIEDETN